MKIINTIFLVLFTAATLSASDPFGLIERRIEQAHKAVESAQHKLKKHEQLEVEGYDAALKDSKREIPQLQ